MSELSSTSTRVRFAPSPTGYLHIGGARSALYNYLYAKKTGGQFIYRVEDTDLQRSTTESMRMQMEDMQWLELNWDEGPTPFAVGESPGSRGAYGPYRQSERLGVYKQHAEKLLAQGSAYYCFCSDELLKEKKDRAISQGLPPHYDGTCRALPLAESRARVKAGEKAAVRFLAPQKDYQFHDLVRGPIVFPAGMVGDYIILRSDGMPVYNFCCVIDDALMKISHVLRAEEHLSNTLRQLMLYEALGFAIPQFGHLSIILDTDRQKMSKRKGATSCHEFKEEGYLPEALLNFIALLGWSSPTGQEILSMDEMIQQFSLERLNSSPAVFDEAKLKWFNATYLRSLPHEDLWQRLKPFLKGFNFPESPAWRDQALAVMKTAMETLKDATALFRPLCDSSFQVLPEGRETLSWPSSKTLLEGWRDRLAKMTTPYLKEEEFVGLQDQLKNDLGVKGKFLFMPIRVAVIGQPHGAELKILVPLIGRESLIRRAEICLSQMS